MIKQYKLSYVCALGMLCGAIRGVDKNIISKNKIFFENAEEVDLPDTVLSMDDRAHIAELLRNLGSFTAGTIKSDLIGTVTGLATLNVLKSGDVMSGSLTLPAGTTASPSLKFNGSTNTGICAATADTLSLCCNGSERILVNGTQTTCHNPLTVESTFTTLSKTVNQSIQSVAPTAGQTVTVNAATSVLLLTPAGLLASLTITFPTSPVEGQYFTIINGSSNSILGITNDGNGSSIVNAITSLQPAGISIGALIGYTTVTYIYSGGTWYRWNRG